MPGLAASYSCCSGLEHLVHVVVLSRQPDCSQQHFPSVRDLKALLLLTGRGEEGRRCL